MISCSLDFYRQARRQIRVPVRLGFEKSIVEYLELEDERNAEGTVITEGNEIIRSIFQYRRD